MRLHNGMAQRTDVHRAATVLMHRRARDKSTRWFSCGQQHFPPAFWLPACHSPTLVRKTRLPLDTLRTSHLNKIFVLLMPCVVHEASACARACIPLTN